MTLLGWASRRVSWTGGDVLLIFLVWTGIRLLAGRLGLSLPVLLDRLVLLGLAVAIAAGWRKADAHDLGLFWSAGAGQVVLGILAGGGLFVLVLASRWVSQVLLGEPLPPLYLSALPRADAALPPAVGLAGALVVWPLAEEVYFRGLVYPVLRRVLRPPAAAVLTGFWYALGVPAWGLPAAPLLGAVLAALYERGGSLLLPCVGHAVLNLLTLVWGLP